MWVEFPNLAVTPCLNSPVLGLTLYLKVVMVILYMVPINRLSIVQGFHSHLLLIIVVHGHKNTVLWVLI